MQEFEFYMDRFRQFESVLSYVKNKRVDTLSHNRLGRLILGDGNSLSIQAGHFLYCDLRCPDIDAGDATSYTDFKTFEVGFPSFEDPLLMPYAEDRRDPTSTIYSRVPEQILQQVISNHGGIVAGLAQRSGKLPDKYRYLETDNRVPITITPEELSWLHLGNSTFLVDYDTIVL